MKDRRFPLLPVLIVVIVLGVIIAAMMSDAPADSKQTEVDVTLPGAASKAE